MDGTKLHCPKSQFENCQGIKFCRIWFLLLVIFVAVTECDVLEPKETSFIYTWASFFKKGYGPVTEIIEYRNQKAKLVYHCLYGEEVTQSATLYKIRKSFGIWVSQRLTNDKLNNLSNGKCQASLVFLGSDHATINFTCSLLNLTVGYDISSCEVVRDSKRIYLIPIRVLVTYGDGTQEFSVDGEQLIPLGSFKSFSIRLKT